MYESKRFPYDGTIDADGHVLEPGWLWERYLEPPFRARAIRIRTDDAGLEYLELDGRPSERTVKDGCRGGWVAPFTHTRKGHGHPDHDPLWRKAVELDVPVAIHPTFEPVWSIPVRFDRLGRAGEFHYNVTLRQGVQQALLTFFDYGTLERFPDLRLGVLESGMGWLGPFLDRCDAVFET